MVWLEDAGLSKFSLKIVKHCGVSDVDGMISGLKALTPTLVSSKVGMRKADLKKLLNAIAEYEAEEMGTDGGARPDASKV